jgi:myo-inositol-1(or 4)-monophosphatase
MTSSSRKVSSLLDCCVLTAREAGNHAVKNRPRRVEIDERFAHDVKLRLDRECQAVAATTIHHYFPGDAILGEEDSHVVEHPTAEWIVDPIDGTVNYFHGLNWWCTSVAVRVNNVIVAGAVYAPEVSMLFDASIERESRLNGQAIHTSAITSLADGLLVTGSEKEVTTGQPPLSTAQALAPLVQKVRIFGAAALDICQVASGAADLFYQNGLFLWDVAAAGLIVQQAGGVYEQKPTPIEGRFSCLAGANEKIISSMHLALRQL